MMSMWALAMYISYYNNYPLHNSGEERRQHYVALAASQRTACTTVMYSVQNRRQLDMTYFGNYFECYNGLETQLI